MDATSFDHILRKVVILPVIALLLAAGVLGWQLERANKTVTLIETNDERIADTLIVGQLIVDQETGLRGYEITHDPRLLQQYYDAEKALPSAFDDRRRLMSIPQRRAEFDAIRNAYETWRQSFAVPLIATIQTGGSTGDVELNYRGKLRMDDIRHRIANLNVRTQTSRENAVLTWHRQIHTFIFAMLLAAVAIGLIIGLYVRRLVHQVSRAFRQSHEVLRLRAEQTFRSEEKLRTTLQSIGDGVITCDPQGRVQSINDTARELTGWSEEEARDQPLDLIFPIVDEATRQPLENPVSRVTRSNQVMRIQNHTILPRRDGSEIFIEDSGAPVRDKHGSLTGVVLVFRDVTLAKRSQDALLASEKLAVAGRLAASIAHEIHNPLDSVSNLLFLMDGVANDEERTHFLHLAKQEIDRVTQISRAMLSLYRESKAPVLIDLREMIDSILLLMETRLQTLRVQVDQLMPEGLQIHGFPAELRQVFTNLLSNAAEATGPGGTITLCAEPRLGAIAEDGNRLEPGVYIEVKDNGPGIPADILPNLFQPFFTTKGERGTGLGLWISRGIITKHGGTVVLTSSTELATHGTTLRIFLATNPTISLPA